MKKAISTDSVAIVKNPVFDKFHAIDLPGDTHPSVILGNQRNSYKR